MSNPALYIETIIDDIQSGRCVIFLGPQLAQNEKKENLEDALYSYIQERGDFACTRDKDGLYHFKNNRDRARFPSIMKRFYLQEGKVNEVHRLLRQLPARYMVSMSPDTLLREAFNGVGIENHFAYYNKRLPQEDQLPHLGGEQDPLIYNLFGSIYEPYSLVISHDDLFDFLFSILGGEKKLPMALEEAFSSAQLFLFLGFEFDKWYLKLILRLLGIKENDLLFCLAAGNFNGSGSQFRAFYENQFEMVFVNTEVETYLKAIVDACEQEGILRKLPDSKEHPLAREVKAHVKKDELREALEKLEDHFEAKDMDTYNATMLLSGRFNGIQRKLNKGTVDKQEAQLELNLIRDGILNLADEI
jgi:hypothetical protein